MTNFLKPSQVRLNGVGEKLDDPKFRGLIHAWDNRDALDVGLVGVPFDLGIKLSGGRVGASEAPDAIRKQLSRYGVAYNTVYDADLAKLSIADLGNVAPTKNSVETHARIGQVVENALTKTNTLIVLGGGNDISYATMHALARRVNGQIGGMNIDAHFDVRPVVDGKLTSGTPYRRLLDGGDLEGKYFAEVGVQGHVNAKAHRDFLKKKQASIYFLSDVRKLGPDRVMQEFFKRTKSCEALFVSIDIDVVAQAFAPGSSAPSPDGLFPEDILRFAFLAGKNKKVRIFEIVEVSPPHDVGDRTSRLAANLVLEFCAGVASRKM